MIKRGTIDFSDGKTIFRISKTGIDVDSATQAQLILDERIFYGQMIARGFAVNTSPTTSHSVVIPLPELGFSPHSACYNVYDGKTVYPASYKYKTGSGGVFYYPSVSYAVSSSSLTLYFGENSGVTGIYYLVFRRNV